MAARDALPTMPRASGTRDSLSRLRYAPESAATEHIVVRGPLSSARHARATMTRPVAVVGLDCATPQLVFDRFADDMPVLSSLRERSLWGTLRSCDPPITIPAWSCMMSGRTPGELGVYGFRNRNDHSYDNLSIANSRAIKVPRLWDMLGSKGGESVIVGVPGTYPPSHVHGCMVSCFLTPSTERPYTYPRQLAAEIQDVTGGYMLDVMDFRTEDKDRVAQQLFDLTQQRFDLACHLATTRPWDLLMFVDMAPDRLHHSFWKHCDPEHPRHRPGNPHAMTFRDYYRALDRHLGAFLEVLPDQTTVMIVSDHGAQPMVGGFCLNEWLVHEGLLVLAEPVHEATPFADAKVDWSRTIAWGDGGYYGRVFLNVRGREPEGVVAPKEYEAVRQHLIDDLERLHDHEGQPMGNRALRPDEIYPEVHGVPPDLLVYFGGLRWRSIGSLGLGEGLFTFENDTGPDDANHAHDGIFMLAGDRLPVGRRDGMSLFDVAPTLQHLLELPSPGGQCGRCVL
jgi:predicted AlkP superfamily phosphohydrolase/phosphomutase